MSTLTQTAPRALAGADTRRRTEAAVVGAVLAGIALCAALTWGTWGDLDSDTGYDVAAGLRIADGELPYADFDYFYGPLSAFLSGLLAVLGGDGFGAATGTGLVITTLIVAATYALARTQVGTLGAALAAAITIAVAFVPSNYSYVLPHTGAATLGTLALLALLLCLHRRRVTGAPVWLTAAGVVLGALALTKPEPALAGFAVAALWLLLEERDERTSAFARLALPAAGVSLAVYGPLSLAVSPRDIVFENLYPRDVLRAGGDTLIEARMPLTAGSVVELLLQLAAYAIGAAALVLVSRRLRVPLPLAVALGVAAAAGAALVDAEKLREALKLTWAWLPAGAIVAVVVIARRRRRNPATGPGEAIALPAALALAIVAFTTYGAFYLHATRPQMAVYYAPLAAILVARLHLVELARERSALAVGAAWVAFLAAAGLGLTLNDAGRESSTVSGPGGTLAETPAEADLYRRALAVIEERTEHGDRILVGPLLTGLTVLSERPTPLRELSFLPGAFPSETDERAALARLEAAAVELAITDRRPFPGYGHDGFGESFGRTLYDWLEANFMRATTLRTDGATPRTLDVWTRRNV